MKVKNNKIGVQKTNYFLCCDYAYLGSLVVSAAIETPSMTALLLERDFSYLMRQVRSGVDNSHMNASVRMVCAFLELGDPFPGFAEKK